jgi:hypothetical protein
LNDWSTWTRKVCRSLPEPDGAAACPIETDHIWNPRPEDLPCAFWAECNRYSRLLIESTTQRSHFPMDGTKCSSNTKFPWNLWSTRHIDRKEGTSF